MTLGNIPRLYTALADWIACMLCISLFPHRLKGWQLRAVQAFFLAVMCVFLAATGDVPVAWFVPCILLSAALMFVFIYLCCDFSPANAGYYCVRAFILAELAASLEWQLYYYAAYSAGGTSLPIRILFLAGTYALIFGLMYALERRRRESAREMEITWRELLSALAIGAAIYAISNLSYFYADTPFSGRLTMEIFNIRTLVDLGGVAILYAYHIQLSELHVRREKDALTNVLRTQYSQYQLSQDSVDLINRKYHDLKHQLSVLRAESDPQKKNDYLDRMEQEIRAYEAQNKTGNHVLDTVLAGKSLYCQQHGVSLTCVADGTALDFMDEMDLCTLFGNALDNAIESVEKLPDPERRLIHLSVSRQRGFLHIRVENTYEGELQFDGGLPATTKADKRYHGYGLKSIRETAKTYGGSVTISAKGGWFELRVLLPLST